MHRCSKFFIAPAAYVVATALLCTQVTPATAAPYYDAQYLDLSGGFSAGQGDNSGSTPQTIENHYSISNGDVTRTQNSFAGAGPGGLTASTRTTVIFTNPVPPIQNVTGRAIADFFLDDVVFSGPPGGTIPVTLLMQLNGTLSANISGSNPDLYPIPLGGASASVGIDGRIYDPTGHSLGSFTGSYQLSNSQGELSIRQSGILSDYNLLAPPQISGSILNVPTNVPLGLYLSLTTNSAVVGTYYSDALDDAISDFSHTLSFPTSGPVFNLPLGYTANSVEGGIVNNAYVAVPEPSTLAMLATGASALLLVRRRKMAAVAAPAGVKSC